MKNLNFVVLLCLLTSIAPLAGFAADRTGIDCGCDEVGAYNVLSKGTLPAIVITGVNEGTSQNGTYEFTVGTSGTSVILTVSLAGGAQLVSEAFTPSGEAHWGFSPDEHRFVYHYLGNMGQHYVRLFDLEDGGTAINENGYGYTTGDSELYFSPHGHYFFYAAVLDPTHTFLSIVNVGESPYEVHELTLGLVLDPANKSGLAAWGFNKKIKDAAATTDAAFLYAYKTGSTNVTWRLIDLASMTVHAEDSVTSGTWWGFSPCGDVLGLIESDTKSVRLVRTIDGVDLYDEGYSDTAAQLSSSPAEHLLNGQSLSPAVPNTADNACPGPPDTEAPTWPEDPPSTLEASAITGTSLTLAWSEAEDDVAVTHYQVYQDGQSIALLDASVQTCDVDGLSPGVEYSFKVEAGDAADNWSSDGPSVSATTADSSPYWPSGAYLEATDVTETGLTLVWPDANDDVEVTQYKVYQVDYPNDIALGTPGAGDLSFDVTGLEVYTYYQFYVQAGDAADNWSDKLWVSVQTLDLSAPVWRQESVLTATDVTKNSLTLHWDESDVTDNDAVQCYLLYLDDELFDFVWTSQDSYYLDCLLPGTTFSFKVEASDPAGNASNTGPTLTVATASGTNDCDQLTERVNVSSDGEQTYAWKWDPWGDPDAIPYYCDDPYGSLSGGEGPPCQSAWSFGADISADGRFVSFYSNAVNLASNDDNPFADVFVHDRQTGVTELVSLTPSGEQFDYQLMHDDRQDIDRTSISADGRYVAFMHRMRQVYVRDRQTSETLWIAGSGSDGLYFDAVISDNGRYVAYNSTHEQLQLIDDYHIYVYDTVQGTTTRVSCVTGSDEQSNSGPNINGGSTSPSISADGRYVAFKSLGMNLVPGDTNVISVYDSWQQKWIDVSCADIFVRDTQTKETTRVSVSSSGAQANEQSWSPAISADGRYVAFLSDASNLVSNDTNGKMDVFVHDRNSRTTKRVSVSSTGEQANGNSRMYSVDISENGRFVTFASSAGNLVPDDNNGESDIFVHDCLTDQTRRVNVCACETEANASANMPSISADGSLVVFQSAANNLLPNIGDTNRQMDIFVHELQDTGVVADLSVTKADSPDLAVVGEEVTYAITVINIEQQDATGVILTDNLPSGAEFVSATSGQGTCEHNSGVVTCDIGTLASGESATVTIVVTYPDQAVYINEAGAQANEIDLNTADNTASEETTVYSPSVDEDNDNMPDGWEAYYGVDDPGDDPDDDDLSNLGEYQNGTDPTTGDSDSDGMPDGWEVTYGLNPLVDDAAEDLDDDGVSNIAEYNAGTNPADQPNHAPDQPTLSSPADTDTDVSLTPDLQTQAFSDPDSGDTHAATDWQISTDEANFSDHLVFDVSCDTHLTSLVVPEFILTVSDVIGAYYWRVRFHDDGDAKSEWSEVSSFTTIDAASSDDTDQNGVPDEQEITDPAVDLDKDGNSDMDQSKTANMKCASTVIGDGQIAVKQGNNVSSVDSIRSIDPATIADTHNKPDEVPLGLICFKLTVDNPGDIAQVTVYLSEPAPSDAKWYRYDPVNGWQDYSAHATFSADRTSVMLEVEDGGFGDADGVANRIIIDPSGLGAASTPSPPPTGAGGGGCFVTTTGK